MNITLTDVNFELERRQIYELALIVLPLSRNSHKSGRFLYSSRYDYNSISLFSYGQMLVYTYGASWATQLYYSKEQYTRRRMFLEDRHS